MKKNLLISVWFTLLTTVMFGLVYPLAITDWHRYSSRARERTTHRERWKARWLENHWTGIHWLWLFPLAAFRGRNRI